MEIKRDSYLELLKSKRDNGMIKVITGLRRSGKSYLLFKLFVNFLLSSGVEESQIIMINLEDRRNKELRDPDKLLAHIDNQLIKDRKNYILLDEVQMVNEFEDVLNSYLGMDNVDVYVTGSNAKFLSKDVITEFRGRGDEIRIHPLSFSEYRSIDPTASQEAQLLEYMQYGGLPQVALTQSPTEKRDFLSKIFAHTYLKDIKERNEIRNDDDLEDLVSMVASSIGGLINPRKIMNTFQSVKKSKITGETIKVYLDHLIDAFIIEKAIRYDIKGKKYIDTPSKYYFEDLGLRNARLNFRQLEETHLMENLVYNELRRRGFSVDVGQVEVYGKDESNKTIRKQLEVDFVCNKGYQRLYIQVAYRMDTEEKRNQELGSFRKIGDNFQRIVIIGTPVIRHIDDEGVLHLSIYDFLLNDDPLKI